MTRLLALRKLRLLAAYPRAVAANPRAALHYLVRDREFTNLTYEIENVGELVEVVAASIGRPRDEIARYVGEPHEDEAFLSRRSGPRSGRAPTATTSRASGGGWGGTPSSEHSARSSSWRRASTTAWAARSSCSPCTATARAGSWASTSTARAAGVPDALRDRYALVLGDVRATLGPALAAARVGLFVHDSLHTYEHERFELELALARSDGSCVLVSDNAHATTALADVCREHGLRYALFRERPLRHFYPGAGLGLGVPRSAEQTSSTSSSASSG